MAQSRSADWKRTVFSAVAAFAAAVVPSASLAEPAHAKGHEAEQRDDEDAKVSVDVDVKKNDPKRAKATKHPAPPPTKSEAASSKKKVEVKADAKVDPKVHAKAEVKVDPKVHAKAEVKVDPKVHAKAEAKVDTKTHRKTDEKVASKTEVDSKTHARVATKVDLKARTKAPAELQAKADDELHSSRHGSLTSHKSKTVASRTSASKRVHKLEAESKPCNGQWVTVDRGGLESEKMPLVDCKGRPLGSARERLSVLVRPWGAARPQIATHEGLPKADSKGEIAPGVRLLDTGLLNRLDAIARHFPGKSFSFVSGYRPQSRGSNHQTGRAVDVRVVGITNEALVAFCRTLRDTGCGYYPNSSFVHVDVRNPGTGSVTWIDSSGPGEAPRYVSAWPPPKVHGTDPANREERAAPPLNEEPHDDITSEQLPRLGEVPEHPLM
jgi:hypothetical protein